MFQLISAVVIAVLVGADQLFKYFADTMLANNQVATFIPGVLRFELVYNDAGMWGFFDGLRPVLSVLTAIISIAGIALIMSKKLKPMFLNVCAIAIVSGGIGNLIDRVARGYVIDYIDTVFCNFPTYNFADILVTCGCFALIGYELYLTIVEIKQDRAKKHNGENNNG